MYTIGNDDELVILEEPTEVMEEPVEVTKQSHIQDSLSNHGIVSKKRKASEIFDDGDADISRKILKQSDETDDIIII